MVYGIKKKFICLGIAILASFLVTGGMIRKTELETKIEQTQQGLAEEVFRFHVLANSDSDADQKLKIKVRDAVLSYMKAVLPEDVSKQETKEWIENHLAELEHVAVRTMRSFGYNYSAKAQVKKMYFPEKRYGDVVFPKGNYEALRVVIGEGAGKNWWCVLYPNLCFIDSVCAVVPEDGKEELRGVLTEDEYEMVTVGTKFKIKWFFFGN